MDFLGKSILATIIYYDVFNFPLTPVEIRKYLINPARLMKIPGGIGEVNLIRIFEGCDSLVRAGLIREKNGFYFLTSRQDLYETRIEREKISAQKWKKLLRYSRWLILAPYLRDIFASGSIALGNTTETSDFDLLIVARSGRLYTCRFFLWVITSVLGIRRKPFQKKAPDKICFNHYITDALLSLPESLFNAQTYSNLKPVMVSQSDAEKLYASNIWINNYLYNFKPDFHFVRRSIEPEFLFKAIAVSLEYILDLSAGNWFERILRLYQQKRIRNNPVTYEPGGRVVFTDNELEFHPRSFEKKVLVEYHSNLKKFGIVPYAPESDSGLKI